ncbi:unnamed protein product [Alternaria alternata]
MTFVSQDRSAQEHAFQTPKRGHLTFGRTTLAASVSNENADNSPSLLEPKISSCSSSTSTVSTVSPVAGFNDMWDAPETPCGKSGTALRSISTPLTPPTPLDSSEKPFISPISKLSFGARVGSVAKQQISESKDAALQDDQFQPTKIFRNLTFELQAISQKNVASPSVKYNINPSFAFSNDPISSRTRSKTGNKAPVTSAVHVALNGGGTRSPQHRTTPSVRSAFGKLLEQILPHDLHARIANEPRSCVASFITDTSRRCTVSKGSLSDISGILEKLARYKSKDNYCVMLNHIEDLVDSVMCVRHKNTVLKQLKDGSRMAQLRSRVENMTRMTEVDRLAFTRWIDAVCDLGTREDHVSEPEPIATNTKPVVQSKPIVRPTVRSPGNRIAVRFSLSSGFLRYEPKKTENLSVFDALYKQAASPLTPKAFTPGFIYLYWDKAFFGKIKIGYTKDLATRLKQWKKQCNPENAYHSGAESQVEMPHVFRVEQLIHTELKECRLRRRCDGCGKMHEEWFEADEAHAVKVLRKWRDWMLQEPYVYDEALDQWTIKPGMLDTLEKMCEPIPNDGSTQKSGKKSVARRPTPQKKKSFRRTM